MNELKIPQFATKQEAEAHLQNCWFRLAGNGGAIVRRFIAVNTERVEIDRGGRKMNFLAQHNILIDALSTVYLDANLAFDRNFWLLGRTDVPVVTI